MEIDIKKSKVFYFYALLKDEDVLFSAIVTHPSQFSEKYARILVLLTAIINGDITQYYDMDFRYCNCCTIKEVTNRTITFLDSSIGEMSLLKSGVYTLYGRK